MNANANYELHFLILIFVIIKHILYFILFILPNMKNQSLCHFFIIIACIFIILHLLGNSVAEPPKISGFTPRLRAAARPHVRFVNRQYNTMVAPLTWDTWRRVLRRWRLL